MDRNWNGETVTSLNYALYDRFMKNWCLLRYFKDFFPAKLVKTADLDPEQSYLICSHPHGILCYGAYAAFGGNWLQVQ